MKARILLCATALTFAGGAAFANCGWHEQQAMSCSDGMIFDSATKTCVSKTTS